MNKKKSFSPPVIGGSSLLVIFSVLCLTVFALLSLSTVLADQRLEDASVKAVAAYYEADCAAEEIFASQTKDELHAKIECVKQCIEQDHSISDIDKDFYKKCFDLFKRRFETERGW